MQHLAEQALIHLSGQIPIDVLTAERFSRACAWPLHRHCERLVNMGLPVLHWEEREILACIINRIGYTLEEALIARLLVDRQERAAA